MTAQRARAYGRLARTLRDAAPGAIDTEQQRTLRGTADELVFARAYDEDVRRALAEARQVLSELHAAEHAPWVDQLAADLADCGPSADRVGVTLAIGPLPSVVVPPSRQGADT